MTDNQTSCETAIKLHLYKFNVSKIIPFESLKAQYDGSIEQKISQNLMRFSMTD